MLFIRSDTPAALVLEQVEPRSLDLLGQALEEEEAQALPPTLSAESAAHAEAIGLQTIALLELCESSLSPHVAGASAWLPCAGTPWALSCLA